MTTDETNPVVESQAYDLIKIENPVPIEGEAETETLSEEKVLLKTLKSYFKLCSAAEDKRIFLKDSTFCTMLLTFVADTRPLVVHYVAKILLILTEKSENAKFVYKIEGILAAIGEACNRYLPTRVLHNLLVVQSRLIVFKHQEIHQKTSTKRDSRQLIYHLKDVSDGKQQLIEQSCLAIRGVTSIGFTPGENYVRCRVQVKESVQTKVVEKCILSCGYDSILHIVKLDNGMSQCYDVYADEFQHDESFKEKNLPKYLDDDVLGTPDEKQGIVPQDYVHENQSSWIGKLTSFFW